MMILKDLFCSPIVRAYVLFMVVFIGACYVFPVTALNRFLDAFVIAGCTAALVRYGSYGLAGLRQRNPTGPDVLLASICLMTFTVGSLRVLREIGLDLGIIQSKPVAYTFAMITATMAFAIFLTVVSPPVQRGSFQLSPTAALILALLLGAVIAAVISVISYF